MVEVAVKKIEPRHDAVVVSLIDGEWFVSVECLNKDNKEILLDAAHKILWSMSWQK